MVELISENNEVIAYEASAVLSFEPVPAGGADRLYVPGGTGGP